jgi:hypothetical protein
LRLKQLGVVGFLVACFIWVAVAQILQGKATLELAVPENSRFTAWAGEVADSIRDNRNDGLALSISLIQFESLLMVS